MSTTPEPPTSLPATEVAPTCICVLGAGIMGAGIADVFARAGHAVTVFDADRERAEVVAEQLPGVAAADSIEAAVRDVEVIVEAVTENLAIKEPLLRQIGELNPTAIIASNTSTYQPSELQPGVPNPGRVLVAHFFNPAEVVPLVEVVPAPDTDPALADRVVALLRHAGKVAVLLRRESVGFVANRLQAALVREALHLVDEGVVGVAALDAIVTSGIGPRWALAGPMAIADMGGLDTWAAVTARIFPTLDDAQRAPRLDALVAQDKLGSKNGAGLYDPADHDVATYQRELRELFGR
ncbi:3-hydroxyacyl-CoA dehydrogenase family protein [Nakamurella leprariae]|uniref:3-hydroxyacyl-CoA dehydrogenase family protein n=1 Tax=Nakamurella leprariae TaxID=2803911 RepID=A0A938Y8X1_9ACTN|nr:3-hydroxyacyl-CoA dehydrogenase family protein [Nakamurella leprariae]MBM9468000.1 3-hydroxyacyl-CoA dehydrogenase family protein [Nakamurella leprariae]